MKKFCDSQGGGVKVNFIQTVDNTRFSFAVCENAIIKKCKFWEKL